MANLLEFHFKRTRADTNSEITLDRDMLRLLAALDERKTLRQVMTDADMTPAAFKQTFSKLYNLRLVEKVEPNISYLNQAFIKDIKSDLVDLLGPLGETLIEDAASEMGFSLNGIPTTGAWDFIERVAEMIPGNKEKTTFKNKMHNKMKGF
ncbi:MAG: hypothetical protein K9K81_01050 [Desulfobacteraceae bacterium]|nr:hypothetical protein [Desulfobacteraceae bacterium]